MTIRKLSVLSSLGAALLYLRQGLRMDYNRRFSEIGAGIADLLNAISAGNIRGAEASDYTNDIIELIQEEEDALFRETLKITRDDDTYLAQAAALFGNAWGTLNLQDEPLEGEQAERRIIAEQKFSYPVSVHGVSGGDSKDILLPIPPFMEALKGAGFTNIVVDGDGIRLRVFLVREVERPLVFTACLCAPPGTAGKAGDSIVSPPPYS